MEIKLTYEPNDRQKEFRTSKAKYRCYLGGWGGGKTYAGCQEALRHLLAFPGNFGLIGRKDFCDLRDTTIQTFIEDVCPPELVEKYNKAEHHLYLKNKSEVIFRELKDGSGIGSLNLGFFYIDEGEEVTEEIFDRLRGRLRLSKAGKQCGWITSNPPNIDHWLYRRFVEEPTQDFEIIYASTYENKDHLPEDYIRDLENMPESLKRKYLFGQFGFSPFGQPVFPNYSRELHRRKLAWSQSKPILVGWDFGYHHPAVVFTQIDSKDRWIVLREFKGKEMTIDEFGDKVLTRMHNWFPNAEFRHFGDPAGHQRTDKDEKTSIETLKDKGISVLTRKSSIREGLEIITRKVSTLIEGMPGFMIDESCRLLDEGFMGGYHYPDKKDKKPFDENPEKDGLYDHLVDCLRYVAVNMFSVRQKPNSRDLGRRRRKERELIAAAGNHGFG